MRPRLTYANVMSTIAVFIALGGASYAAFKLPKNSVGTKQIKKNAVTTAKLKKEAVTAAKVRRKTLTGAQIKSASLTGAQIDTSTLGTVPTAGKASSADTANSLAAPEAWHEVGTSGEPAFHSPWHNSTAGSTFQTAAFFKDHDEIVHLRGVVDNDGGSVSVVFQLPPGFRPPSGKIVNMPVYCTPCGTYGVGRVSIYGPGIDPAFDGAVRIPSDVTRLGLDGVTFRAES